MSRFTLSPRAALVVAAVVVVVALVVIVLGARGSGAGGVASVTGAASVAASVPAGGAAGAGAGAGAGASAGAASGSAGRAAVPSASSSSAAPSVVVHVLGAVAHAGVVTVPGGGRVADALDAAGGASGDADLTRLNLARPLVDGERLYVPRLGEVDVPQALGADSGGGAGAASSAAPGAGAGAGAGPSDVVDLNTADQATLETLPGIGPGLAQRILAWRDEHGRFSAVEDLLDVSGIGDGRFAELQDRVRV